jgi:hypothetical protein
MAKLDKNKIQTLYERCLNLVRRKPCGFFIFKKMRGFDGSCNWDDIEIDPRGDFISTAYHECIHYIEPEWSETQVLYAESRMRNVLGYLDHAKFLKHISIKLYESELKRVRLAAKKKRKNKKHKKGLHS